jgi:hypothetical protein
MVQIDMWAAYEPETLAWSAEDGQRPVLLEISGCNDQVGRSWLPNLPNRFAQQHDIAIGAFGMLPDPCACQAGGALGLRTCSGS